MKISLFLTSVALILFSYLLPVEWFATEKVFIIFKATSSILALILVLAVTVILLEKCKASENGVYNASLGIGLIALLLGVIGEIFSHSSFNFIPWLYVIYLILVIGTTTGLLKDSKD